MNRVLVASDARVSTRGRPRPHGARDCMVALVAGLLAGWSPQAVAASTAEGAAAPLWQPTLHRTDAVVVRLVDAASRTAAAHADRGPRTARLAALGLAGLDAAAAALGGATFEREFPPEPRASTGRATSAASAATAAALEACWLVHLPPGADPDGALAALRAAPEVAEAARIALVPVEAVPNDSLWSRAWHLWQLSRRDVHAPEAWDVTRGDSAVVIGIVDTGVLTDHPDLRGRIWTNAAEAAGAPGVDDDLNGFVDDRLGWDFVALDSAGAVVTGEDWRDADGDPNDFAGHGTAVAGLAGGHTDNVIGIAGSAWDTRLMPLRAGYSARLQASGLVDLSFAARAIVYAVRNGAGVLNLSFLSASQFDLNSAADYALEQGVPLVTAAGNGQPMHYLAGRDEVIAVSATDSLDRVPAFTTRGPFVALAAPGVNLVSTLLTRPGSDSLGLRQPSYLSTATGTSFSAPLVAGAVALMQSDRRARGLPPLTPYALKLRLMETADDIAAANPGVTGYGAGRLNVGRALTDPVRSWSLPAGVWTVGPGVALRKHVPPDCAVFATAGAELVFADLVPDGAVRSVPLSGRPLGGVAAADLGGGHGNGLFVATRGGKLDGFDDRGRPLPGWPVDIHADPYAIVSQPSLGDLDGDGVLEVVWGGGDGSVGAWRADGSVVAGFPRVLSGGGIQTQIALADLDGQPGVEIVATASAGPVHALRGDGTYLPGWPVPGDPHGGFAPTAPVVLRLGASRRPAIAVATGHVVRVYDAAGSSLLARSPFGYQVLPLAAADVNGDGSDELVIARSDPYHVVVMDSSATVLADWPVPQAYDLLRDGVVLVGSLAPGGGPGVLLRDPEGHLRAFAWSGAPLAGFPKPGGAGASPSIANPNDDGATDVMAGSGRDLALFLLDAGAGTWNPAAQLWPTAQGNAARTNCTFGAPPLAIVDNVPPNGVTDLGALATGTHEVELLWTAPYDDGPAGRPARYEARWAAFPLAEANFGSGVLLASAPSPGTPGEPQRLAASGLPENAALWFAVRSFDLAGNASPVSNAAGATTGAAAPGAVHDLRVVSSTDSTITLRWTATGDDGASGRPARYRVRGARTPLDPANFAVAPLAMDVPAGGDAGTSETAVLAGLRVGHRYWVALVAEDASGQASPLSNVVSTMTGPLAATTGLAVAPRSRPSGAPVELFWQGGAPSGPGPREIRLFDLAGRLVRALPLGDGADGVVRWDARDENGNAMRSGLYFAVLVLGEDRARGRVVLVE